MSARHSLLHGLYMSCKTRAEYIALGTLAQRAQDTWPSGAEATQWRGLATSCALIVDDMDRAEEIKNR